MVPCWASQVTPFSDRLCCMSLFKSAVRTSVRVREDILWVEIKWQETRKENLKKGCVPGQNINPNIYHGLCLVSVELREFAQLKNIITKYSEER